LRVRRSLSGEIHWLRHGASFSALPRAVFTILAVTVSPTTPKGVGFPDPSRGLQKGECTFKLATPVAQVG
jgi:hypothetical protein